MTDDCDTPEPFFSPFLLKWTSQSKYFHSDDNEGEQVLELNNGAENELWILSLKFHLDSLWAQCNIITAVFLKIFMVKHFTKKWWGISCQTKREADLTKKKIYIFFFYFPPDVHCYVCKVFETKTNINLMTTFSVTLKLAVLATLPCCLEF